MTEETSMNGLAALLDRATDAIDQPYLAAPALAESRHRRARKRALSAAGAAAAVVLIALVAVRGPGAKDGRPPLEPIKPSETNSATPSPTFDPVQPRWDPFTVADEPFHDSLLPRRLDPPASAPDVADDPMAAAVIAWPEEGQDLRLLGTDGTWRSVPDTSGGIPGTFSTVVTPILSSDGRQVAMSMSNGILIVDVTTGERRTIPWPDQLAGPWDTAPRLYWLPNDDGFAVSFMSIVWRVDLDGEIRKAPYGDTGGLAFDPSGRIVERRFEHNDIRVWRDDQLLSTAPAPYWGERMVTRHGLVAFTGAGGDAFTGDGGPIVVDASTGNLLAYAPIRDQHSTYSDNGFLSAKGFLDQDTVLLLVGPIDFRTMDLGEETWHLVAWKFRTGSYEQLATGDTRMRTIDVAGDVLAADWRS